MRFNQTCIAWVDTTSCPDSVALSWKIMCLFFAGATAIAGLFTIITIARRLKLIDHQNMLFKILAPQLLIWVPLQFLYMVVHGASRNNFGIPASVITLVHLQSSMVLGNIIPQVILTWSENYQNHHDLSDKHYQRYYWLAICIFTIITGIISVLAGVNVEFYHSSMRALFGVWISYLITCVIMLLYFGIKNYQLLLESMRASLSGNEAVATAKRQIVLILAVLCGVIFIPVIGFFLYYAIDIYNIEKSKNISFALWCILNACSTLFVVFWDVYIWVSTTTLLSRQDEPMTSTKSTSESKTP